MIAYSSTQWLTLKSSERDLKLPRPIHVVFCAHDLPGNYAGGPNAWLVRLLPDLRKLGLRVSVLVIGIGPPESCPLVVELRSCGLQVRFLHASGKYRYLQNRIRWIGNQLNELKPDVFVPNVVIAAYYAARWARKAGIPSIAVIHSNDAFHHQLVNSFVTGEPASSVEAVVAVSAYLERVIKHQGPLPRILKRIPCGVPSPAVLTRPTSDRLRVAYVGRFAQEQKRICDVTRAFCRASKALPKATFTLLGDGSARKAMSEIIAENHAGDSVKIDGPVPPSQVLDFMRLQDVFVLLSDYEGMPIALQEAMAVGTVPVCLREESGISELICHGENGLIVENRDSDFISALRRLNDDRDMLQKLSANAIKTIHEGYEASAQHRKWFSLISEVSPNESKRKVRPPNNLRLPAPHPSFRGEDLLAPPWWKEIRHKSNRQIMALRLKLRPRARLRAAWRQLTARN